MFGNETLLVAEVGGQRLILRLDRARRLVLRAPDGQERTVEPRPVVEFAGAVDGRGRLHVAAWLMSRHLMYLTSTDGMNFTRSTLLQGDMALRLRDLLLWAGEGEGPAFAYVAETDRSDTLVCYRRVGEGWEGVRVAECERPERLHALQHEGAFGQAGLVYCVRGSSHTNVLRRDAGGHGAVEPVARIQGGLNDFCATLEGGARMACWLSDGFLFINGARHEGEPWLCTFPHLRRVGDTLRCQWLEQGSLRGVVLGGGAGQAWLAPRAAEGVLCCLLALPGETHRAVLDSRTLQELICEVERPAPAPPAWGGVTPRDTPAPQVPSRRPGQPEPTLTDVVRNQAIMLTRLQGSVAAMERTVLRLTAEVNALRKETSILLRSAGKDEPASNSISPEQTPAPQEPPQGGSPAADS